MATFTSVQDGNWDDGATWGLTSPGVKGTDFPGDADIVNIAHVVDYNEGINTTDLYGKTTVNDGGVLAFPTDSSSTIRLGDIVDSLRINVGGELRAGTALNPIEDPYICSILFERATSYRNIYYVDRGIQNLHGDSAYYGNTRTALLFADWTSGQTFYVTGDLESKWKVGQKIWISRNQDFYANLTTDSYFFTIASLSYDEVNEKTEITISESAPGTAFTKIDSKSDWQSIVVNLSRNVVLGVPYFENDVQNATALRHGRGYQINAAALASIDNVLFYGWSYCLCTASTGSYTSDMTITNCVFRSCESAVAQFYDSTAENCVCASITNSFPAPIRSTFKNCLSLGRASAGFTNQSSTLHPCYLEDCTFINNQYSVNASGGLQLTRCIFVGCHYVFFNAFYCNGYDLKAYGCNYIGSGSGTYHCYMEIDSINTQHFIGSAGAYNNIWIGDHTEIRGSVGNSIGSKFIGDFICGASQNATLFSACYFCELFVTAQHSPATFTFYLFNSIENCILVGDFQTTVRGFTSCVNITLSGSLSVGGQLFCFNNLNVRLSDAVITASSSLQLTFASATVARSAILENCVYNEENILFALLTNAGLVWPIGSADAAWQAPSSGSDWIFKCTFTALGGLGGIGMMRRLLLQTNPNNLPFFNCPSGKKTLTIKVYPVNFTTPLTGLDDIILRAYYLKEANKKHYVESSLTQEYANDGWREVSVSFNQFEEGIVYFELSLCRYQTTTYLLVDPVWDLSDTPATTTTTSSTTTTTTV